MSNGATSNSFVSVSSSNSSRQIWQRYRTPARGCASMGLWLIGDWQAGQRQGIGRSVDR